MKFLKLLFLTVILTVANLVNAQDRVYVVMDQFNNLPSNTSSKTYENLIKEYGSLNGDIMYLTAGVVQAVQNGHSEVLALVDKYVLPSQKSMKSIVFYDSTVGMCIGQLNGMSRKAIDYLTKSIDIAERNNLNSELFHIENGEINHLWSNVAVNYERLGDLKNSAYSYLKGAKAIKKQYPSNQNDYKNYLMMSSYMMSQYYKSLSASSNKYNEYAPFIRDYATIGDLQCIGALGMEFIDNNDRQGIKLIETEILPKEKDQEVIRAFKSAISGI